MTETTKVKISDEVVENDPIAETEAELESEDADGVEDGDEYSPPGSTLEDYPDDEEIWPEGPTVGDAKAWKAEYGRIVVGTMDNGEHYIIRPLNRAEYRNHVIALEKTRNAMGNTSQTLETLATEEAITRIALLYPNMDDQKIKNTGLAGLPTLASQQILEISGFVAVETTELF